MTKERLKRYRALKAEAEQIRQKLLELESAMYSPKAQRLTGMPRSGGGGSVQDLLTPRHIELQQVYVAKLAEVTTEQIAIENAINALEPIERMLLRYRYIDGLEWSAICVRLNYEWTRTHEYHNRALRHLREKSEQQKEPGA